MPFIEQYDLLHNPWRSWADIYRPMPDNMKIVTHYESGKYDFAILHVDQQSIYNPYAGDRMTKGLLYREANETIRDIPKIVINHMTPFHDKYSTNAVIDIIKKMVGDNIMVVNSHQAKEQWGWGNTIVHGMRSDEYWDLPKEPRATIVLSPAGMNKAYRREFGHNVVRILNDRKVLITWVGVSPKRFDSFDAYRDYLGRSLVFFFPAWQSPMPRARTEAMLSGCCIVTTPYQDAHTFIEDGVNGFLTSKTPYKNANVMDNPEYTADLIERLVMHEPELALEVGRKGKQTAEKLFNSENFAKQWETLLKEHKIWK